MTTARARRRLACLLPPLLIAACRGKEPAPPPATPPPTTAAATTTTTTTTTVPTPPPVWREARWGMTKAEVLAAFPGEAQTLPQPADFGPQGGSTDVAIPSYEMEGMAFRVLFGFEADALNRVRLAAIKAGPATCGDVEKVLTAAHAAPADRNTTQTNLRVETVVWKRPDQVVTLICSQRPSLGYNAVSLDYTPPFAPASPSPQSSPAP
jgi:hypothetical protein